ncbi:hypothetical protein HZC09_03995, partial [Candidatus Micrarchaeota archaeon]|nr:hypothetical protein [Candidatus Micrarchaeota archaeon]
NCNIAASNARAYGIYLYTASPTIQFTTISTSAADAPALYIDSSFVVLVQDSTLSGVNQTLVKSRFSITSATFMDVNFDKTKVSIDSNMTGNLVIKWHASVYVTDSSGSPLDATVNVSNNAGMSLFSGRSGASGLTNQFEVIDQIMNRTGGKNYNNHIATVSKPDYQTNVTSWNISSKMQMNAVLLPSFIPTTTSTTTSTSTTETTTSTTSSSTSTSSTTSTSTSTSSTTTTSLPPNTLSLNLTTKTPSGYDGYVYGSCCSPSTSVYRNDSSDEALIGRNASTNTSFNAFLSFSTSSIPSNAVVLRLVLWVYNKLASSQSFVSAKDLNARKPRDYPDTLEGNAQLFGNISSAPPYAENLAWTHSPAYESVDLGDPAVVDFRNLLSTGLFSLGITSRENSLARISTSEDSSNSHWPMLTVYYLLRACMDGTLPESCSATQPLYCDELLSLSEKSSLCGCPSGQVAVDDYCVPGPETVFCEDNTSVGQCSSTKPLYCDESAVLVEKASVCNCPNGTVAEGESCVPQQTPSLCDDQTPSGECSITKPLYCTPELTLVPKASACGCPSNLVQEGDDCFTARFGEEAVENKTTPNVLNTTLREIMSKKAGGVFTVKMPLENVTNILTSKEHVVYENTTTLYNGTIIKTNFTVFTLTVTNVGDTPVENIEVSDSIPAELFEEMAGVSFNPLPTKINSNTLTWMVPRLNSRESKQFTYTIYGKAYVGSPPTPIVQPGPSLTDLGALILVSILLVIVILLLSIARNRGVDGGTAEATAEPSPEGRKITEW